MNLQNSALLCAAVFPGWSVVTEALWLDGKGLKMWLVFNHSGHVFCSWWWVSQENFKLKNLPPCSPSPTLSLWESTPALNQFSQHHFCVYTGLHHQFPLFGLGSKWDKPPDTTVRGCEVSKHEGGISPQQTPVKNYCPCQLELKWGCSVSGLLNISACAAVSLFTPSQYQPRYKFYSGVESAIYEQ